MKTVTIHSNHPDQARIMEAAANAVADTHSKLNKGFAPLMTQAKFGAATVYVSPVATVEWEGREVQFYLGSHNMNHFVSVMDMETQNIDIHPTDNVLATETLIRQIVEFTNSLGLTQRITELKNHF